MINWNRLKYFSSSKDIIKRVKKGRVGENIYNIWKWKLAYIQNGQRKMDKGPYTKEREGDTCK